MFSRILFFLVAFSALPLCAGVGLSDAAKHRGTQGLRVSAGAAPFEIIADSEQALQRMRLRFYVRLRDLVLDEGTQRTLLQADQEQTLCLAVTVGRVEGAMRLGWQVAENGETPRVVAPEAGPALSAAWHAVEFEWVAGEGNGVFQVWLDDAPLSPFTDLHNGSRVVTAVRLGLPGAELGDFRGSVDFDSVVWRDRGEVGREPFSNTQMIEHTSDWPARHSVLFLTGLISEATTVVFGKRQAGSRQHTTEKEGVHED
ncbi:hypothetical protein [Acanthopleuribacter pedis]|uniref:Uncharacterized protein n=1 Tax=Acanthopleuribacter pedis TaxID=442870 RepID=A0A8J7QDV8_9BACT|nr:hypothetical protein [Acanthopleuribacter pedis]MBO1317273.1 hypothetical protein [Acanthopleuribacter pedis]MBO1318580.1 hypothetical protein [Acanthopleuribacter pedis]